MGEQEQLTARDLMLVRSDQGDGDWSLHMPDAEPVASNPVLCGEAEWSDDLGAWDRPNEADYAAAQRELEKRQGKAES